MNSLIVYYSHSGNNAKLAYELKERLGCEIIQVCELKKRNTFSILLDVLFKRNAQIINSFNDIKKYDNIIFVSPIWGGKIATPMRAFMDKEKDSLDQFFFISLCNGMTRQKDNITNEIIAITKRVPKSVTELSINSLLPEEKQNKIKYTFNFRVKEQDLNQFNKSLETLIKLVNNQGDSL